MDERKNLLGPNLIKNENIMPLLYQFLKVYQLKMTKQYQTRTVFENISTSIMTVDYSRVPSPSSCVPLPPLGGGGGGWPHYNTFSAAISQTGSEKVSGL